jgi:hypothetical protein
LTVQNSRRSRSVVGTRAIFAAQSLRRHFARRSSDGKASASAAVAAAIDLGSESSPEHDAAARSLAERLQLDTLIRCQQIMADDAAKQFRGSLCDTELENHMLDLFDAGQPCTGSATSSAAAPAGQKYARDTDSLCVICKTALDDCLLLKGLHDRAATTTTAAAETAASMYARLFDPARVVPLATVMLYIRSMISCLGGTLKPNLHW